ncbi:serine carboxypeptidase [Salix suchowensis]|nr:serine carboxypeptidase [Salix suchowensis]
MGSKSLKEYLKKYGSNDQEDEKKVKKKKKKVKPIASGVLVVDEDPVWQKPVKIEEEENDSADEDKPQVDEDIEVKRMKRLELIRARRTYNAIAEDGSGWVILSPKHPNSGDPYSDMSPHYKRNVRNDTPSPEHEGKVLNCGGDDANLSPPRQKQRQHHSPSPVPVTNLNSDLSPPRKRRYRNDTPSPEPQLKPSREASDLSPPQRQRKYHHSPSPKPDTKSKNFSGLNPDLSPPRRQRADAESPKLKPLKEDTDLSPPRQKWRRHYTPPKPEPDLSPPRKRKKDVGRSGLPDNSHLSPRLSTQSGNSRASMAQDISPPRKNRKESSDLVSSKELPKTGLITGRDMREEIKTKKEASLLLEMDPSISGRGAEPVYRDKKTGERISKDDYLKSKHKVEEKPKEKKLEWGKGLAQKREAETRLEDLELEKDKPFARTRDDPELDKMLKERLRWGDPMAHLVKKKHSEPVLADLGDSEKMKESGFVIPQDIPSHSWIKRGLEAAPNRYGIRPGRHWDGVDRSNGNEKQLFKRMNEKQATEREAYLWSVSDM